MITLSPSSMADLTPVLAAIPSGTAAERQVVVLPAGEFETDLLLEVVGKRFWSLIGGPTTLHFPTYGPASNDGNFERRHTRFDGVSDFYVGGLKIHGPHGVKSVEDPTRAKYDTTKAFQHGFVFARSHRVTAEDLEAYEIGGDGIYVNDTEDLHILGARVEFNGRQGLGGIEGERWLFERLHVVNSGRNAIDFEPVGLSRWISSATIRDSDLKGGVALHRVSMVTFERDKFRQGAIIATGSTIIASQRRYGLRIIDNEWPDGFRSNSRDAAPIQLMAVNGVEVRGNRCHRDLTDDRTVKSVFVEMRSLPATGHVVVQGNDLANFVAPFKWRTGLVPPVCVTTDIQG